MPSLIPTSSRAVWPEVLPVDRVAGDGLEDGTDSLLVMPLMIGLGGGGGVLGSPGIDLPATRVAALHEATPPLIAVQPPQQRELRTAADERNVLVASDCDSRAVHPRHEAAHPAPAPSRRAPVKVVAVVTTRAVPLGAQPLYPQLLPPALECPGAGFYAPDHICPGDDGDLGVADGLVLLGSRAPVVGDCRWLKARLAVGGVVSVSSFVSVCWSRMYIYI